jgi:alpha-L-fucosidase
MRTPALLLTSVLLASAASAAAAGFDIAAGKFKPDWGSLESRYRCPDWFRDAKFGIWAHWGPQCQPEQGDWYARALYQFGSGQYKYQVEHYGHPSKAGFKDVIHLWRAENFDPDKLIALYKKAGAKYFVAMANHHDNFDNYNSKYQPWNSVALGPKQDLVGKWAAAARKAGLRFGVTVHTARAWTWYEVAQGADPSGPLAGVPYDGKLTKADGIGQWWEGFDPQDLYSQNHPVGATPSGEYCEKFFKRTKQLIDDYKPDLLYFDDRTLPLNAVDPAYGLNLAAHFYNSSIQWHGRNEAVMNTKGLVGAERKALVWDLERNKSDRLEPFIWQTDTCIGGWHYNRVIYDRHGYKTPDVVVRMLVDIVSKNGNLLLNIPVRSDGTIDEDETSCLEGIAQWTAVNGEAIFGTRPWKTYGEGALEAGFHSLGDVTRRPYTPADLRFTTKGNTLYAIALGWPADRKLLIKTLGAHESGIKGDVTGVELLGSGNVEFARGPAGLVVTLPEKRPCETAWALKITGLDLAASQPGDFITLVPYYVRPDRDGSMNFPPEEAKVHGRLRVQGRGPVRALSRWNNPQDSASWQFEVSSPGEYRVVVRVSAAGDEQLFDLEAAGQTLVGRAPKTAKADDLRSLTLGRILIDKAGVYTIKVRPHDATTWKGMNYGIMRFVTTKK